jgi:hypothetical protein
MTTPTPAAPATPVAPAAVAPVAPAAPAALAPVPAAPAPAIDSLIPPAPAAPAVAAEPAAPAAPVVDPAAPIVDPLKNNDWFVSEGVKGTGAPPEWFKADKYKTLADQAKAYPDLEKRFGAFTGAPKEGYEFKLPETVQGELDKEHPIYQSFETWAKDRQLNNEGFNELLGMFAEYEAAQAPNIAEIKASLGDKADERIAAASQWAHANMTSKQYETFRAATSGPNAAQVFEVLELAIARSRQPTIPAPGAEVRSGGATPKAIIDAERAKLGPNGRPLIFSDAAHREKVDRMTREWQAAQQQ